MHQIYLLTLGKRNIILTSMLKEGKKMHIISCAKKKKKKENKNNSCNCAWSESGADPARRSGVFFNKLLI